MKIKALYIAGIAFLASCSDNVTTPTYTVGEADNAIVLRAGISESSTGVATRAAEDHHTTPGHKTFTANTQLTLRVDGTWLGKANGDAPHGTITSTLVSQETTATIGDDVTVNSEGSATHNKVTFTSSEQLYWDDYGTADPANMPSNTGNGRAKGLTIYGVAVDGKTDAAPTVSSWIALPWNVGAPATGVIDQTGGWSTKDLLTSNNVKDGDPDDTYKFDERASGKLLEFTHAMTKVTVELTAGAGFADAKFVNKPDVTLLQFYYTGTYDIESKTPAATTANKTNIKAHLAEVKETSGTAEWSNAPATWASSHKAKYDALVFPGNSFTATIATEAPHTPTSETDILKIDADGNIYTVTAAQLVKAIVGSATGSQTGTLAQAKNYILKITVNKTSIDKIDATIKDWVNVEAGDEAPKINIVTNYGDPTTGGSNPTIEAFTKDYTFLRSLNNATTTDINHGYTDNRWMKYASTAYKMYNPANGTEESPLYWPDHSSHYFFRGVYPRLGTSGDGVPVMSQITDDEVTYDVIAVQNEKYNHVDVGGHSPSDLLIAYPHPYENVGENFSTTCRHEEEIETNGICATEGKIVMNFEHAMSQVEVKLVTNTADGATNNVIFDEHTTVEIIGGYSEGYILLKDGSANFHGKTTTANYTMNREYTEGEKLNTDFLDAIIPQSLVDGSGNPTLKFRITVTSSNGVGDPTLDSYETVMGIKDIPIQGGSKISKWEPGKKYIYTLTITKTGIVSTATIKNWEEVTATEDVWF